jgi:papain like protease
MAQLDIESINRGIEEKKARWQAVDHPLLRLSEEEQRRRLGVILDEGQLKKHQSAPKPELNQIIADYAVKRELRRPPRQGPGAQGPVAPIVEAPPKAEPRTNVLAAVNTVTALRADAFNLVQLFPFPFWWLFWVDWRNRWGTNYVTPVTDQGGCGSCVSFGTIATLESMVLIEHNLATDLSEAELLFCGGGSCGGWWPDSAVNYLTSKGVAQESCFPYVATNVPCSTCAKRDGEAIKVLQHLTLMDVTQRKDYLYFIGPTMCVFEVFSDFYSYHSGVYSHVAGGSVGLHCVEVIGYDDFESCWICKNSWGSGWGDGGFFKIAYGQCQIDTTFPFWGIYHAEWYS